MDIENTIETVCPILLPLISKADYVVFTDGSGSTADAPAGFAVFFYDKMKVAHKHCGVYSHGTVNQSELMPVINFLGYLSTFEQEKVNILFISDSAVTVNCGNGEWVRNFNKGLWAALDYYKTIFNIKFHWIPRGTMWENRWADDMSKEMRKLLKKEIV